MSEGPGTADCAVIIPAYNPDLDVLREAVGYLLSREAETVREVIVVDDGSPAPIAPALPREAGEGPRLRVVRTANGGAGAARNAGVASTDAPIVAFLDSDCVPGEGWARRLTQPIRETQAVLTSGTTLAYDLKPLVAEYADFIGVLRNPIRHRGRTANVAHVHFAIRREVYLAIGGFAAELRRSQDLDFTYRLFQAGYSDRVIHVPDATVTHKHRDSLRSFLRQAFQNGQGAMAHCLLRGRDPREIYVLRPTVRGALFQLGRILSATSLTITGTARRYRINRRVLIFPVLTLLRMSAYNLGSLAMWRRYRRNGRLVFA